MAHDEACQLYIKQEIERGLEEGRTPYSIGKDLSKWIEKLFEASIPATTIEKKAERIKANNLPTNVGNNSTTQNNTEKEKKREITKESGFFTKDGCGGPGRPPQYQPNTHIKKEEITLSNADQMVKIAIQFLSRISIKDPQRTWAKNEMIQWINANL